MTAITRRRGDTYADEFVVKSKTTKLPMNITDCTFVLTLDPEMDPVDDSNNVYSIDGVIVDAAAGRVEFAPTEEQADQLGSFFYDVQMIDAAGRKRTIALDSYTYTQDISKA